MVHLRHHILGYVTRTMLSLLSILFGNGILAQISTLLVQYSRFRRITCLPSYNLVFPTRRTTLITHAEDPSKQHSRRRSRSLRWPVTVPSQHPPWRTHVQRFWSVRPSTLQHSGRTEDTRSSNSERGEDVEGLMVEWEMEPHEGVE